ncbi:unnamed protein product [Tilletia laevis]|uniref:Uncharacterized protein n=3 Tax=Tilletia TaxID=13289 RepID=A0A8X7MX89_9BASI|nr:hypothetical protein CF336_g1994 [Tilletia laevis]KAE8203115.1 hypothetical protein CF328_g1828 [Tilletia controversa]KAE8264079.1 hypothetical protein A4X03_0g1213 [Tilletia caries]KAE8207220.1 hypothetical protein CF335_g1301 [Tilletia laevis]KAE8252662.1 hypothetical protein A4X06_0g2023 [Tilletia controversa]
MGLAPARAASFCNLAHAAAVREQQVSSIPSRNLGREAELEFELRRTRDELAAAQAWMRQAREKLGMPHSDP